MNRHIAVVTPVLDDWACFSALVMEISNRYTGTDLIFHIYGADDGSIESLDAQSIALPADSCVAAIEILHLALNLGHQRAIAVGLCAIADRAHFDAVLVMDSDGEGSSYRYRRPTGGQPGASGACRACSSRKAL